MAVPFNIPGDQNEVEVIIGQLQTLLNRLQIVVRQGNLSSTPETSTSRARTTTSSRAQSRGEPQTVTSVSHQSSIPDLLNSSRSWLALASQDSSHFADLPVNRSLRRRRTSSESSYCEEAKISVTTITNHGGYIQDWNQVGVTLRKIADDFSPAILTQIDGVDESESKIFSTDGIFSRFVPTSVSSCSLWTAMICFVGWHIFRAR